MRTYFEFVQHPTALTIEMLRAMPTEDALLHAFVADFLRLPEGVLRAYLSRQRPESLEQDIFRFLKRIRDDRASRFEVLDHYVLVALARELKINIFVASYQRRTQEHELFVGCSEDVSLSSTVVLIVSDP